MNAFFYSPRLCLSLAILSCGLSPCSGIVNTASAGILGGNSGDATTGQVIGGYYENARVCFEDKVKKATCDARSVIVKTGTDGSFKLPGSAVLPIVVMIDNAAIEHDVPGDLGNEAGRTFIFRAPSGHTRFVSAISTELAAAMDTNGGNFADASKKLAAKLTIDPAYLTGDFNHLSGEIAAKIHAENKAVTAVITSVIAAPTATADNTPIGDTINKALAMRNIQTVVVIYAENRGFDNLYGLFPGADGIPGVNPSSRTAAYPQKDFDGNTLPVLPPSWGGMTAAGQTTVITQAQTANLPNKPFQIDNVNGLVFADLSVVTRDLVHRFYNNQMQINGGKNNLFAAYSDAGALSMGYYDGSKMKLWDVAKKYTLADRFFMGAFGGSFLNHQYLICACAPTYPDADNGTSPAKNSISAVEVDASGNLVRLTPGIGNPTSVLNGAPVYLKDGTLTPKDASGMFYAVNTMQPLYQPSGNAASADATSTYADANKATTLPAQTQRTIGDQLSVKSIKWAWYSGAWNAALADASRAPRNVIYAGKINFQPPHQPFNYYRRFDPATANGAAERASHMKDFDASFLQDAAAGKLPPVSFYKPQGNLTQHSGFTNVAEGDAHIADVIAKLQASPQWKNMLIVVTYDDNGGYWDHVAPPKGDRWGPGTRLPAILVSPYVRKGFVDHTQYDTASILRFITRRYGLVELDGLKARDAALVANGGVAMGDLSGALTVVPQE
ncbi:acid phosphatase [Glaciimonas sp. Gout2]|uniref:acid phosphatase n=1 Tax=unclassified Glaciimonas TaxID=2644401 RepID=UPI002B225666|nr:MULTISPECIES: acid phosphatase [unclassified Glaciimonas]MEB0012940.1 acid phosphatase [Glaciimonas sp. Cout2]MEB0080768.1 acid phosphatase [Glaciimonas sp. Gout2]